MSSAGRNANRQKSWRKVVAKFQKPVNRQSYWQMANSIIPFLTLWVLAYLSLEVSYWLTLPITLLAAGFMVRIFIIFHDCGHGSFFKSRKANERVGFLTGILTLTPFYQWRHAHALHHATSGDLDRRGSGDIWLMTVNEYRQSSLWRRIAYRIYRNPFVMFVIGPTFVFVFAHRFAGRKAARRERNSVWITNLVLATIVVILSLTIGFKAVVLVHLPILMFGAGAGVWLFYVQHQYEGVYWERHEDWDYFTAAIEGSSFYKLPKLLQWFTGNIGFHHIHHLSPRIPNYHLEPCHKADKIFQIEPITLLSSLNSLRFRLWDEANHRLVGYSILKQPAPQPN